MVKKRLTVIPKCLICFVEKLHNQQKGNKSRRCVWGVKNTRNSILCLTSQILISSDVTYHIYIVNYTVHLGRNGKINFTGCNVFHFFFPNCINLNSAVLIGLKDVGFCQNWSFSLADSNLCKLEKKKKKRYMLYIPLTPFAGSERCGLKSGLMNG